MSDDFIDKVTNARDLSDRKYDIVWIRMYITPKTDKAKEIITN